MIARTKTPLRWALPGTALFILLAPIGCATTAAPALVAAATPTATRPVDRPVVGPAVGRPLPDLAGRELATGAPFSWASLKGQVVLIDVWASWCAPCQEELPLLDDMAARLRDQGVQIVAVSIDEDEAAARDFLRLRSQWSLRVVHDADQKTAGALAPPKMPSSYLVDRDGVLRAMHAGFAREDAVAIESELRALATAKPVDRAPVARAPDAGASLGPTVSR